MSTVNRPSISLLGPGRGPAEGPVRPHSAHSVFELVFDNHGRRQANTGDGVGQVAPPPPERGRQASSRAVSEINAAHPPLSSSCGTSFPKDITRFTALCRVPAA
jgi:hypothetical protein